MSLSATDSVGDFLRAQVPKVIHLYRTTFQEIIDDASTDETTRAFLRKRLARLEELSDKWRSAWFRFGAGPGHTAKEQDEILNAVLQAEAQLAKECPHIFDISYYRPVWKRMPDDMEI
jgi:hypothetical protein